MQQQYDCTVSCCFLELSCLVVSFQIVSYALKSMLKSATIISPFIAENSYCTNNTAAMTEQPDLSLPERVPEMERYHDAPMSLLPFALYTLCKLDNNKSESYRQMCATEIDDDQVRLPPRRNFHGESLRAIIRYHVELGRQGEFDATYFIVCAYGDCSSVVLVTLDDDDIECKPDLLWVPMDQAGLLCTSLQIFNTDWSEAKEQDLGGPLWWQPAPGRDLSVLEDVDSGAPDDEDYGPPPPVGFHVQLYTIDGIDQDKLLYEIQPGPEEQKCDPSQHSCKLHHLPLTSSDQSPAREAANLHPSRCLQHQTLQKSYLLLADTLSYPSEGVQVVHIAWDGITTNRTSNELLAIGETATIQTQRAEVSPEASRAAVPLVLMLAQGYEKWAPKHKVFALYAGDYADSDIHISQAVDARWAKRGPGQDRVVFGGFLTASEREENGFWRELLLKHVACCRGKRFVPNFEARYLVWCGDEVVTGESEVLLVKVDWDGDSRSREVLLKDATNRVETWQATARDAHRILSDVVESRKMWKK